MKSNSFTTMLLFLVASYLVSCGQSQNIIQPTQTATSTIIPTMTFTHTNIPLASLKLDDVIVIEGDLPAGYTGAQITNNPNYIQGLPVYDYAIMRRLARAGNNSGWVTIYLYEDFEKVNQAYKLSLSRLGTSKKSDITTLTRKVFQDIGEKAEGSLLLGELAGIRLDMVAITFIRCRAMVDIQISDLNNFEDAAAYASRLDKRLLEMICY